MDQDFDAPRAQLAYDAIRDRYGLGVLPKLQVTERAGMWQVRYDGYEERVTPMAAVEWEEWIRTHFGQDWDLLETTEG